MMRIVCAIFSITIKDLKVHLNNLNLPIQKSVILFEFLAQKEEINK